MRFIPDAAKIRPFLTMLEGYERFLVTLGAGAVDTVLLAFGLIDQGTYSTLTLATVGAFIAGSTVSHVTNIKAGNPPPAAAVPK